MSRPLTTSRREQLADWCDALATELRRPDAAQIQRGIGDAVDGIPYPSRTSTAPAQPHNRTDDDGHTIPPDTLTEQKALNPDRIGTQSAALLGDQDHLLHLIARVTRSLVSWRTDRGAELCSKCGSTLPKGSTRCNRIIDGVRCSASSTAAAPRMCIICEEVQEPGQALRSGRCDPCRKYLARNGRERVRGLDVAGLTGVRLTDEGAAHA